MGKLYYASRVKLNFFFKKTIDRYIIAGITTSSPREAGGMLWTSNNSKEFSSRKVQRLVSKHHKNKLSMYMHSRERKRER